jgi:hypothetical protein
MPDPAAIEPDEIIPPGASGGPRRPTAGGSPPPPVPDLRGLIPSFVAKWLDELLRIPGTNIKIGLDPLLALIPAFGGAASTTAGAAILLTAVRYRAPFGTLLRMAGNMAGNAFLDLIPVLGPAASIWFRSNSRNNQLLQKHLAGEPPGPASAQTKILMVAVALFIGLVFALGIAVWVVVYRFVSSLF